jgi:DNA-binding NarL/FixJ family response regulator
MLAVGQGKTNAEIAGELFMSVATVKAHITHILTKLDVGNRTRSRCWPTTPASPEPDPVHTCPHRSV